MRSLLGGLLCAVIGLSTLACGAAAPSREEGTAPGPSRTAPAPAVPSAARTTAGGHRDPWPTYHHDAARSGRADAPVGRLRRSWTARLSGGVYGEPIVVGGGVLVGTENNDVVSLAAGTGAVRWRRHLGTPVRRADLPCGDIDPLGITGTPAYDAATGSVFVVAETTGGRHTLWALDARTGEPRWHRSLDIRPHRDRLAEQQRSALLVLHHRVIATFGGLAGDCGDYVGYAASVATDGTGPVHSYAVPTPREGGMWTPPGPVEGPTGNLYVSAGNGATTTGSWDGSDSVTELTPVRLRRIAAFAPATWREDNAADLDLGSSAPAVVGDRLVIAGKRGVVYLLRPGLGGVGSAVRSLSGCTGFGGAAVVDAHSVLLPCLGEHRIRELHVGRKRLRWGWSTPGLYASPVTAGRRAYVADRDSGDLVVLRLADGHEVQRLHAGALTHFPSASVAEGRVFVPTLTGVTAFGSS